MRHYPHKYFLSVLMLIYFSLELSAQSSKVIGYLPYYRFHLVDEIRFDRLTHLCLAFANPDMDGNLDIGGKDIDHIVEAAHAENNIVFISLAGGALTLAMRGR